MPAPRAHPRAAALSQPKRRWTQSGPVPTAVIAVLATGVVASMTAVPAHSAGESGQPATSISTTEATAGLVVTDTALTTLDGSASKSGAAALKSTAAGGATGPRGTRLLAYTKQDAVPGFSLYGVTWDHQSDPADLTVAIRTLDDGGWSPWTDLEADLDGGPVTTSEDSAFRDGTEPAWVGAATGIEVAVFGSGKVPTGLQVSTIDPGSDPVGVPSEDSSGVAGKAAAKSGFQTTPRVVTRRGWGADESLGDTCWDPIYGKTFKALIIHHTAGSNSYTRAESKALVRGVYAYHTQSRGWCDIGYNFLVDKFGTVFEGRAGGIRKPVRGAHAGDYNVNTTGISLMGNFETAQPTQAMKNAVVRLAAWRLGTAYHEAYGRPFLYDGRFSRISGHRNVMATACPGKYVYTWLPTLRARVQARIGTYESAIERYWRSPAGQARHLGPVAIGEQADERGHFTSFRNGSVYASRALGLRVIERGPLLNRYRALGQTSSYLRYPTSRISKAGTSGQQIEFQGGRIYWAPRPGANDLRRGAILTKYRKLNGASGRLGFPKSPITTAGGDSVGSFQHGTIRFDLSSKTISVTYR